MASSSWHRLGEGFAADDNSSPLRQEVSNRSDDAGKSSQKACGKNRATKKQLNKDDFLSSFSLPVEKVSDSNSVQSEDITWSGSSSDEEDDPKKLTKQIKLSNEKKKRLDKKASSGVKKRPAVDSILSGKAKNLKCDSVKSCDIERTDTLPKTMGMELFNNSALNCSGQSKDERGKKQLKYGGTWNVSTFEDIDMKKMEAANLSSKKPRTFRCGRDHLPSPKKIFEDVNIVETESSSEGEDVIEKVDEESDVEDDASCVPDPSCRTLQTNAASYSLVISQEKENEQVEIGSVASSGGSVPTSQKVGASDWAVRFQQEVSPSNDGDGNKDRPSLNQHDSSKKKQKFSSNSMVGQLSRLIKREKSSMRFWQHSVSKGTWNRENSAKSIILEIVSMWRQVSLCITKCCVVNDNDSLLHAKACQVMFVKGAVENMDLQPGNQIQLFPPWKQLDEGDKITILCANQVRPIANTGNDEQSLSTIPKDPPVTSHHSTDSKEEEKVKISLKWTCPCKQNSTLRSNQCPAYQSDHFTNYFSQMSLSENSSPSTHSVHLHSVQSSGLAMSHHALPSAVKGSLLQSIQEERAGADCMPPFAATLLRVFRQKVLARNAVCLSVLLEDTSGTLALVQQDEVDTASHTPMWSELYRMEGRECICQGLTVITRRTKDRDSSLFQVISHVWHGRKPHGDSSQDGSQLSQIARKVPSFCYILQPVGEAGSWLELSDNKGSQTKDGLELRTLTQAVQVACHQRFSCVAKVIDVQQCMPQSLDTSGLFVCDGTDGEENVTAFYPLTVSSKCVPLERCRDRKPQMFFLQDVVWDGSAIQADEYSTLLSQSARCGLGVEKLLDSHLLNIVAGHAVTAPRLGQSNTANSFVRVSGRIVNIDADKCYSWEGCGECGAELTTADESSIPVCPACGKTIPNPDMRMNMEVGILEDSCKDSVVKINLTQQTISSLLPLEIPNEGYDMDQVLGKPITALAYILERKEDIVQLYQLDV